MGTLKCWKCNTDLVARQIGGKWFIVCELEGLRPVSDGKASESEAWDSARTELARRQPQA